MISRIRIDAFGVSAADVEHALFVAYSHFNSALELDAMPGEQVIERQLEEPHGTRHAFKGRLTLHPDVQENAPQRKHVERAPIQTGSNTYAWSAEFGLQKAA